MDCVTFFIIAIIITVAISTEDSVIQVPNFCERYPYHAIITTRSNQNKSVYVTLSTNPEEWANLYHSTKECGLQYGFKNRYGFRGQKRIVLDVLNMKNNTTDQLCSIKAEFSLDERGAPIKTVTCFKERTEFLWPAPRFYVKFTSSAGDEISCTNNGTCDNEIELDMSVQPCNSSCVKSLADFKPKLSSYRYLEEVNDFFSTCPGETGCLADDSQGYEINIANRSLYSARKSCSMSIEIRVNKVCLRRYTPGLRNPKLQFDRPTVVLKIDGKFFLEIRPGDFDVWWCLPWNLRRKLLKFSWNFKAYSFRYDQIQIIPQSNKQYRYSNCQSKYATTTRSYWSTWSSYNDDSSNNYDSSSDSENSDKVVLFAVLSVAFIMVAIVVMAIKHATKKESTWCDGEHDDDDDDDDDDDYRRRPQIPLTASRRPEPQYRGTSTSVPLLQTRGASDRPVSTAHELYRPGPSAPEPDHTPPDASLTQVDIDARAPPPSYEDLNLYPPDNSATPGEDSAPLPSYDDVLRGNYIKP